MKAPEQLPQVGEVFEFLRLSWEVEQALEHSSRRLVSRFGVTGQQRLVLRLLGRFPTLTAGQLAHLLHVDASTITGILRRLEKRGLILRRTDPVDGRRFLFALTDAGRQVDLTAEEPLEKAIERTLAGLPGAKVSAAREVLQRLVANLRST